jgi:hypothetical protein
MAVLTGDKAGKLEIAQRIGNHASPRTATLYDRHRDKISLVK